MSRLITEEDGSRAKAPTQGADMTERGIAAKAEMLIRNPVAKVFEAFVDPAITSKF